jgi:hypothetical protein
MGEVLIAEEAQGGADGNRRRLSQGAQGGLGHNLGGMIQEIDCPFTTQAVSDLIDNPAELVRPFPARYTLSTRLVLEKLQERFDHVNDAGGIVHDQQCS